MDESMLMIFLEAFPNYLKFILGVFSAMNLSAILVEVTRYIFFYWKYAILAKYLHETLLTSVMRSPMTFFDSNPLGRVLNRFSYDIDIMENMVPIAIIEFCNSAFEIIIICFIICCTIPLIMTVLFPIGLIFILV